MTPEQILIQISREHPDFYEKYVIKGIVFAKGIDMTELEPLKYACRNCDHGETVTEITYTKEGRPRLDAYGRPVPPGIHMQCGYCRRYVALRETKDHHRRCKAGE